MPQYGFLRLKCGGCGDEIITAFSCKKRGFCPSCAARRSAETAFHLCDEILPYVPYRQFVVTYPIPLRYWLHTNKKLFSTMHGIVIAEIQRLYTAKHPGLKNPQAGIISFTQRWGSALNLNVHHHILVTDGVYHGGTSQFVKVKITNQDIEELLHNISSQALQHLQKEGYLDPQGEVVLHPDLDPLFDEYESLKAMTYASTAGRIAFGPNAGQFVTKLGSGFGYSEEIPLAKGRLCFSQNGFSVHAGRAINTLNREGLRQLIGYISRGPLANERLEILADEKVKLKLKTPYRDGTSHLVLTYSEFIEKLAALIPPPRSHLVRWSGAFGSNSPYRPHVVLNPEARKGFDFTDQEDAYRPKNYAWAIMLAKVFGIDVLKCEQCGGQLNPIAALKDQAGIARYLRHVGINPLPPARGPPESGKVVYLFDEIKSS